MDRNEIKEALTVFYKSILKALQKELGDTCTVMAYDAKKSISLETKGHCELDLVRWEEIEDADHNDFMTRLLCHWEVRITDQKRIRKDGKELEHRNLSLHVRSLAMAIHMLIRKNRWGLDFTGIPTNIVCEDDMLDKKLNEEEQWLVSFSQEITIGDEEAYFNPMFKNPDGSHGIRLSVDRGKNEVNIHD